jgi:hypothetical protein
LLEHTEAGPLSKMMKPGMGAYRPDRQWQEAVDSCLATTRHGAEKRAAAKDARSSSQALGKNTGKSTPGKSGTGKTGPRMASTAAARKPSPGSRNDALRATRPVFAAGKSAKLGSGPHKSGPKR